MTNLSTLILTATLFHLQLDTAHALQPTHWAAARKNAKKHRKTSNAKKTGRVETYKSGSDLADAGVDLAGPRPASEEIPDVGETALVKSNVAPMPLAGEFKFTYAEIKSDHKEPSPIFTTPENLNFPIGVLLRLSMHLDHNVPLWYGYTSKRKGLAVLFCCLGVDREPTLLEGINDESTLEEVINALPHGTHLHIEQDLTKAIMPSVILETVEEEEPELIMSPESARGDREEWVTL